LIAFNILHFEDLVKTLGLFATIPNLATAVLSLLRFSQDKF